jgi:Bacterial archaeo-eukaryotic release factor family 11
MHLDVPTTQQITALFDHRHAASVSIYLPTGRSTLDAKSARTTLSNIRRNVEAQFEAAGVDVSPPASRSSYGDGSWVLEELDSIIEDDDFWTRQRDTLAIFISPGHEVTFRLPNQLAEATHVGERFFVKPLLRATTFPHAAYVLALSKGEARLLEIFNDGPPVEVAVPDMPRDAWVPPANHFHMARDRAYVRLVDHAIRPILNGSDLPVIVAATEGINALFRTVNSSPRLVDRRVPGNPEELSDLELADAARTLLDEVYATQLADLELLVDERNSQGRAAFDLADIARFATIGAVDTVVLDVDIHVPGTVDEATGAVEFADEGSAETYGVTDEIARRVLRNGGRVVAVRASEVPMGGSAAAILRYTP